MAYLSHSVKNYVENVENHGFLIGFINKNKGFPQS